MQNKYKRVLSSALKVALGFVVIFPLIIMLVVSFQPKEEVMSIPFHLSIKHPTLDNFIYTLKYMKVLTYLKNTFIVIGICMPAQIITSLLAAYAFSFFDFPCKNALFTGLLLSMMIPGEVVTTTLFKMMVNWGLINTYASLTITHMISVAATFMFRQNMLSLPRSLWEAARMDGCGYMKYFGKIMVPLCKPLIVARVMESFIAMYNSHLWPLLVVNKNEMRTMQVGIASIVGAEHNGIVLSAATVALVIPIAIFIFGMDHITEGMTAGAVKN